MSQTFRKTRKKGGKNKQKSNLKTEYLLDELDEFGSEYEEYFSNPNRSRKKQKFNASYDD